MKMKKQNGITLIALIITIIVMLILVGVSVTIALDGGLFRTAKNASQNTMEARDAELKLDNGKVKIGGQWYNTYQDYLDKNPIQTYVEIEPSTVILKVKESADVETEEEEVKTAVVKAKKVGMEEEDPVINWTVTPANVVTLSATTGDEITITLNEGITTATTVTLKAIYEYQGEEKESENECTVTVETLKTPSEPIEAGDYVEYDIAYTDVFTGYGFTSEDGWRYLGTDSDGNYKIVSTGVAIKVAYDTSWDASFLMSYSDFGNLTFEPSIDGEAQKTGASYIDSTLADFLIELGLLISQDSFMVEDYGGNLNNIDLFNLTLLDKFGWDETITGGYNFASGNSICCASGSHYYLFPGITSLGEEALSPNYLYLRPQVTLSSTVSLEDNDDDGRFEIILPQS